MFNVPYFKYLLSSKKFLFIFFLLANVLSGVFNIFNDVDTPIFSFAISIVACYVCPLLFFSFVHNNKANDTYFSLPLKRKTLLCTTLIFILFLIYVPYALSVIVTAFSRSFALSFGDVSLYLLLSVGFFAVLIIFNTAIFLFANSVFDGTVILGAYSLLPLILYLAVEFFLNAYVVGYQPDISSRCFTYMSPAYMVCSIFFDCFSASYHGQYLWIFPLYFILFSFLLYRLFNKHNAEKAGSCSDSFFAYPLIIYLYTVLTLFLVCANEDVASWSFIAANAIYCLLIFVLFTVAQFVFRRRLQITLKSIVSFVMAVILVFCLCMVAEKTEGFGLSYKYPLSANRAYEIYAYPYEVVDEYHIYSDDEEDKFIEVHCYLELNENEDMALTDKMEELRMKAIDNHYHQDVSDNSYAYLYISNFNENGRVINSFYYYECPCLTYEELLKISYQLNEHSYINILSKEKTYELVDGELIEQELSYN